MSYENESSEKLFEKAYDLHYSEGKLEEARELYTQIINEFPTSREAGYAKTQIQNIENDPNRFKSPKEKDPLVDPPVVLTTASTLEGYRVTETLEVISAECAFGINFIDDFLTSIADVFGGRSKTTQKYLRDARKACLLELKHEAYALGANAVIAVKLDYSEFSGKGKSMLFLVATGTAVKVVKTDE